MKKKRITILVAVLLFGVFALSISLFHKNEKDAGAKQQETSTIESSEQEGSTQKNASMNTDIFVQEDVSGKDVEDIDNQTEMAVPSQQDLDNEAEIPENWGE